MTETVQERAQQWLIEYLNTEVDPYDFQYLMADWDGERAAEIDNDVSSLTEEELAKFTKWLRLPAQRELIMSESAADSPSYLYFAHDARPAKKGGWFIHFTNETPFKAFEYGAHGNELALTTHFRDRKRHAADCNLNNSGELGIYETLYGFAFDLSGREWRTGARKYGRNAIIFQHDTAVNAYHYGDEETQSIFPLCGEYNAVPVYGVDAMTGGGTVPTEDGDVEFESWQAIAAWAEAKAKPKAKRKSKKAVQPALGGLSQASRWAPGVKVKRGTFLGLVRG